MDSTIRNTKGTVLSIMSLVLAIALPVVGFGLLVAQVPNQIISRALHGLTVSRANAAEPTPAAAQPMVFEGEVITLAEADMVSHRCEPATDEAGVPIAVAEALRFVPVCEQDVGPIGDLAVATNR